MGKKTIRKNIVPIEEEPFFDRDEARKEFWRCYDEVKETGNFQVIMYYGIGGMGKSSLLHQIEKEVKERDKKSVYVYYDFNDGQDSVVVLRKIVKDLQDNYNMKFPIFLYAVYAYMVKCGINSEQNEIKSVLDDIPILREAFEVMNFLPGISTFSQPIEWLVDKVCGTIQKVNKLRAKQMIEIINNASKEKLHDAISGFFITEMNENLNELGNPIFVLVLDTYERLVNELSAIGTPLENDLWLRDDNDGILLHIENLVCVLAGREELKWRNIDSDWDDEVLSQIEIDTLDEYYSVQLLERHNIKEDNIQRKILEVTNGMPLYLDICVDTYKSVKSREDSITIDLFDNKIEKMAKRLLTYMSDEEKDVLYLLSCLGRWDDDEFFKINDILYRDAVNTRIYQKILELTFVRQDPDGYYIHQTMQEIMIQYCELKKIYKFVQAIYNCADLVTTEGYKYIYLVSKICAIRKDKELITWWMNNIIPVLELYIDTFYLSQFITIYELLFEIIDDYSLNSLYLNYLLKKGDYVNSNTYIEKNKRILEKNDNMNSLQFMLTASYYYYIKGRDSEAMELRQYVYDKRMEILGASHRDTVRTGLALAASLSRVGKYSESIVLGNSCRELLKDSNGGYDSIISVAKNQLGDSYFRLGKFDDALTVYEEVYRNRKEWLGERNNSTMIAYNHIADCYVCIGKHNEALRIYDEVLSVRISELNIEEAYEYFVDGTACISHDHADTVIVYNNMAVCLMYLNKWNEAKTILKEVVAKRKVLLDDTAPATLGAMENLAICEYYLGEYDNAISHIRYVVDFLKNSISENHYDMIIARYHLSLIESNDENKLDFGKEFRERLSFNAFYSKLINEGSFIGYFSLGRYYE